MFFKIIPLLALPLLLGACLPQSTVQTAERLALSPDECPRGVATECYFVNSPVTLLDEPVRIAGRTNTFFPTARPLEFVDGAARKWVAPQRTLTDGASVPLIFVPIVGSPTTPEFVNAAAVHDAYCGIGNEDGPVYHSKTWQETHRVFYDSLIVGGTPAPKAKLMFAAVWLGGPRWDLATGRADLKMERLPLALRLDAMRATRDYISGTAPTLAELLRYLVRQEARMMQIAYASPSRLASDSRDGDGY